MKVLCNFLVLVCLTVLIFSVTSCKKQEQDFNKSAVSLVVLPVIQNGFVNGQEYSYTIKGMVVSPQKVETQAYGFRIRKGGGSTGSDKFIRIGDGSIVGSIEAEYLTMDNLDQSDISLYAVLENGDTLSSISADAVVGNPLTIISPGYTNSYTGFETFTGTIENSNSPRFIVVEMGIEYALSSDYPNYGYTDQLYTNPASSTSTTPIFLQYSTSSGTFIAYSEYYYRIYARAYDTVSGSYYITYSPNLSFIAQLGL